MKADTIEIPISPGEALDKVTILEIKKEKIRDTAKLKNVSNELEMLDRILAVKIKDVAGLKDLRSKLKEVNLRLWKIEDDIRDCEKAKDFGEEFIRLARSVYFENDSRAKIKKEINILLGSEIVEEKSYQDYS